MSYQDKDYYKYYIAEVSSYKQANELRLSSGVKDAFITKCPSVLSNSFVAAIQPEIVKEIKASEELTDTIISTEATTFVYKQKENTLQESIELTDTLTDQPEIPSSELIVSSASIPESPDMFKNNQRPMFTPPPPPPAPWENKNVRIDVLLNNWAFRSSLLGPCD